MSDINSPTLLVSSKAFAKLRWSTARNYNEFNFWGIIEIVDGQFKLVDVQMGKHKADMAFCDPDMAWYSDWVIDQVALHDRQPWQLACWIHTHPEGLNKPSFVDERTFSDSFGDHHLAFMVIMTRDLLFNAKMTCRNNVYPGVDDQSQINYTMAVQTEPPAVLSAEELQALEQDTLKLQTPYVVRGLGTTWPTEHKKFNERRAYDEAVDLLKGTSFTRYDYDDEVVEVRSWPESNRPKRFLDPDLQQAYEEDRDDALIGFGAGWSNDDNDDPYGFSPGGFREELSPETAYATLDDNIAYYFEACPYSISKFIEYVKFVMEAFNFKTVDARASDWICNYRRFVGYLLDSDEEADRDVCNDSFEALEYLMDTPAFLAIIDREVAANAGS